MSDDARTRWRADIDEFGAWAVFDADGFKVAITGNDETSERDARRIARLPALEAAVPA